MEERGTPPRADTSYELRVHGVLGDAMLSAFPELQMSADEGTTVLSGHLRDPAALYGVLAQLEALGVELIALRRMDWA